MHKSYIRNYMSIDCTRNKILRGLVGAPCWWRAWGERDYLCFVVFIYLFIPYSLLTPRLLGVYYFLSAIFAKKFHIASSFLFFD